MVSTDLTSISDDALGILLNERIIALNVSEECLDVDFELTPYSKTRLENLSASSDDMQTTMMSGRGLSAMVPQSLVNASTLAVTV